MSDHLNNAASGSQGNSVPQVASADPYDVPTTLATGKVIFGWALVGIPLLYGVITTLSKVGQLFG